MTPQKAYDSDKQYPNKLAIGMADDLYLAIGASAKAKGESRSAHVRRILSAAVGIEYVPPKPQGRPRHSTDDQLSRAGAQCETIEAKWRVADLKRRGYTKHAVAAITRLPHAEVERLWGAA